VGEEGRTGCIVLSQIFASSGERGEGRGGGYDVDMPARTGVALPTRGEPAHGRVSSLDAIPQQPGLALLKYQLLYFGIWGLGLVFYTGKYTGPDSRDAVVGPLTSLGVLGQWSAVDGGWGEGVIMQVEEISR